MIGFLSMPAALWIWAAVVVASLLLLLHDMRSRNPEIAGLMKLVWVLTVAYSGPLGLAGYFWSGRKQIAHDTLWRRAFRSVAHCYSGCGAGEAVGVFIAAGLFSLGFWPVAVLSFLLAYLAGIVLTVGPMMQEGVAFPDALRDAIYAETPSIAVMEIVAIGVDRWISVGATMAEPLFWSGLIISLSCGLIASYPVNALLIRLGVKEGMHDPREMARMHDA